MRKMKYLQNSKDVVFVKEGGIKTNRFMKTTKTKTPNILEKMMADKKAIHKCIREGGDLKKIAKERNIRFATPI